MNTDEHWSLTETLDESIYSKAIQKYNELKNEIEQE
jgi:hypothetical protein